MDIYIDIENLKSLLNSKSDVFFEECIRLLKKQLNIYFNFSKSELQKDSELLNWLTTFAQGVGKNNKILWDNNFPDRPLKTNSANHFNSDQLSSIYLLNDGNTPKFKDAGAVLTGDINNEIDTLKKCFLLNDDYDFSREFEIGGKDFKKWEDLKPLSTPLTDIIIIDNYPSTDFIDYNLSEFLTNLTHSSNVKLNIIYFTLREHIELYEPLKDSFKKAVIKSTGKAPCFTFVTNLKTPRSLHGSRAQSSNEHDRFILTNYLQIKSGDSFVYFDSDWKKITQGRYITYNCLAKQENHKNFKNHLDDLQKNIDFLIKQRHEILGDKKSNYLNFNNQTSLKN